jgi:glycosyltransferase involved in cell wall biosynthesis
MQIYAINGYNSGLKGAVYTSHAKNKNISVQKSNVYPISFGHRNIHQIAEFTPECTGTGLPEMAQGGEGVVGFELGESLNKYEKVNGKSVDDRKFFPIWNHANPQGRPKFLIHVGVKTEDLPDTMPANMFKNGDFIGQTKEEYAAIHNFSPEDLDYVVQSKPNGDGPKALSRYNILEPTSAKGVIEFPSSVTLGEIEKVPYQVFKLSENNPSYVKFANKGHNYFIYTPEWARTAKPYSYDCFGNSSFDAEIVNSNGMRALAKILATQMDTDEFGYYKPASFIAHDRPASTFMVHIANMSASGNREVNGMKAHKVEHNPSFDYQGRTYNPFQMISVVGNEKDIEKLKKHPQYSVVAKAFYNGGLDSPSLSEREKLIAKSVIEPYIAPFRDYFGGYNITKIPIVGVKRNPENFSLGSVSWHFDQEMRSPQTPDAAKGLTGDYASIETKPVANGVTIANLRFDERDVQFGRGDNGLSKPESTKGFTPFKYDGTNINEVLKAKEKNARWLTNLMWKAGEKGQNELNKLFFNKDQILSGQKVMGYLSPIKDGEILIFGLGRPDTQKGFPISTGSVLHFFKRKDIPQEMKLKVKFLFGAGKWNEGHPHYKAIEKDWKEICELEGGIYKHNFAYIDGFTPNRLNACSHYGSYTSEYEMFGITPIEAKAAGSPSSVTATGGFLDYTVDGVNGFTTKDVVMGKPEVYGLTYSDSPEALEKARIQHQIPQVSDNYKRMIELYTNDHDGYVKMCKRNLEEKVDWHNNSGYNNGKSANRRYLDEIFESNKGWKSRFKGRMNRLAGSWGDVKDDLEAAVKNTKSRPARVVLGFALAMFAIGSGIYSYIIYDNLKAKKQAALDKTA